jgi:hypothetical protein
MSLPLLALRTADLSAPLPTTTIRIDFNFYPNTVRVDDDASIIFNGPSVLMVVIGYGDLSLDLQAAAVRLSEWLSNSMDKEANMKGNTVPDSDVNREWSMTWEQFSRAIAMYTCPKMNTPAMRVVDEKRVPYIVSRFEQRLLDDDGRQVVSVEFAVYEELLATWIS